jgi:tetratricopeptide (TPR) repeat protein
MRKWLGRSLFFATMAFSGAAFAEPTPSEIALARRLFADALVLENAGNWAEAIAKLKDAIAIKETPGLRYHLAHCQEQRGELVAASLDYERASELIRAGAQAPDVEQLLELANQRLLTQIPRLTLVLPPGVPQAVVEIDGKVVSPAVIGNPAPIDPGPHRIVARAPGHQPFEKRLVIGSGEASNLELSLVPLAPRPTTQAPVASPKPAAADDPPSRSGFGAREATLIGEAALVAAGVGIGIGFTLARADATDRAENAQATIDHRSGGDVGACEPAAPLSECAQLREALEARQSHGRIAAAGFVGAGVSAAALMATWILWPSSQNAVAIQLRPRDVGWDLRAGVHF